MSGELGWTFDPEANALYCALNINRPHNQRGAMCVLDIDIQGCIVGVEIIGMDPMRFHHNPPRPVSSPSEPTPDGDG